MKMMTELVIYDGYHNFIFYLFFFGGGGGVGGGMLNIHPDAGEYLN